jgi:hypothetical protein
MSDYHLKRYSKRRTAGDQTSGGRGKLLRPSTDLSRIELVIRETLQNSWDAADEDWYPAYGVRVYEVSERTKALLKNSIFTDLPDSLALLEESLDTSGLHAIEIYDRGTSGLDGPYRASDVAASGEPNNFNSFVFDIGTTKDSSSSGGTFGFGKTATFEISSAHSVVYWTRCRTSSGKLEHRLIAASLHEPYAENGARYTGAHWWGDPADDDIVPLRGPMAAKLGESIFHTHFGDDETGTSILILDPVISFVPTDIDGDGIPDIIEKIPARTTDQAQHLVSQITDAIAKNAWPKVIPFDSDPEHSPMAISVYQGDDELDTTALIRARFSRFADSLIRVREAQNDQESTMFAERPSLILREETYPIRIRPSRSNTTLQDAYLGDRTDNIVGHLHMVASLQQPNETLVPQSGNALCLMRNEAELVVQYDPLTELENPAVHWHGVFKPVKEADKHFRATEPSTHDSWNPSSAESEVSNDLVRRALASVRRKAREFLSEHKTPARDSKRSVRAVANSLRSFVPFGDAEEAAPPIKPARPGSGRARQAKPTDSISISGAVPLPRGSGQEISVQLKTVEPEVVRTVTLSASAVTADGKLPLDEEDLEVSWQRQENRKVHGFSAQLTPNQETIVTLKSRVPTVLEVTFRIEAKA